MTYPKFTKPTEYKKGGKKKKSSGKPKPTNPSLWSRAKSMARSKFDVYPSAYANAWAAKWYKSKGGGWRGGSKKKAVGGPTPKVQSAVGNLMTTYFSHLTPAQQDQVANAVFLDDNSIARTTALVESGNLDALAKSISENQLAMNLLKGKEIGIQGAMNLGKEMFPEFKDLSDSTGIPGRKLIRQGFQDVRDLEKEGYLESKGYETDAEDTKAFEVMGALNDPGFIVRGMAPDVTKFSEYTPKANGGPVAYQQGGAKEGQLMKIEEGGTHEESKIGGVPMGMDADGNMTLVEEGETVRKGDEQDFVFSDRLRLTKQDAEEFGIDKKYVGKTFAQVSEKLESRSRRKNDPIDKQTVDIQLNRLEDAQELFKQRKLAEAQEMYGGDQEEPQAPEAAMPAPQGPSPEQMAIMQAMAQGAAGAQGGQAPMMPPQAAAQPPMQMPHGGPHSNQQDLSNVLDAADSGAIQPGVYTDPNMIFAQNAAANAAANATPYQAAITGMTIDPAQAATPVMTESIPGMGAEVSTRPSYLQSYGASNTSGNTPPYNPPFKSEFIEQDGKTYYVEYDKSGNVSSRREVPTYETGKGLDLAQASPVIANLVASGFMPEDYNPEDYRIATDDRIITKEDITSQLQDINRVYQGARGAVGSRAGSLGELQAATSQLAARETADKAKVYDAQRQQFIDELEQQMTRNLEIAKSNSDMQASVDAANKALGMQKRSLQLASATELSAYADAKRQEELSRTEIMQRYMMNPYLLNQIS